MLIAGGRSRVRKSYSSPAQCANQLATAHVSAKRRITSSTRTCVLFRRRNTQKLHSRSLPPERLRRRMGIGEVCRSGNSTLEWQVEVWNGGCYVGRQKHGCSVGGKCVRSVLNREHRDLATHQKTRTTLLHTKKSDYLRSPSPTCKRKEQYLSRLLMVLSSLIARGM